MALEPELITTRFISGTGVLSFPESSTNSRFRYCLVDVVRKPTNEYTNRSYPIPKSRYGNILLLQQDYVLGEIPIEYPNMYISGVADITGQNLIAIKCAYEGILESIANLARALNLTVTSVVDLIKEYESLNLLWDELQFSCFADTLIKVSLYSVDYEACDTDSIRQRRFPRFPRKPDPVPPGTPSYVDAPLDDDNFTEPFPGDGNNTGLQTCTINYFYNDLFDSAFSGNFSFEVQNVLTPITLEPPVYSNFRGRPNNTPLTSIVRVRDSRGSLQTIQVVNNSVNGHSISSFTSDCF